MSGSSPSGSAVRSYKVIDHSADNGYRVLYASTKKRIYRAHTSPEAGTLFNARWKAVA